MRVKAIVLEGEASPALLAELRAAVAAQADTIVIAPTTVREIIECVAYETGVSVAEIIGDRRDAGPVRARFIAVWLASRLTGKSLAQVGRAIGGRDHSTILHALKRGNQLRQRDPAFAAITDRLVAEFEEMTA